MAKESALWKWLRDGTKHLMGLHLCRVENHITEGYPDVEGCYVGKSFHIELKAVDLPKKEKTPITIGISTPQINWLRKRYRSGGSCFVLLRIGSHSDIVRYLIPGNIVKKQYQREELERFKVKNTEEIMSKCSFGIIQ